MKLDLKKIVLIVIVTGTFTMSNVSFAYQSRPGYSALKSTTVNSFFENIRRMEETGGAFGLSATIAVENGKVVETTPSNNIDVHMIKSTEWGAVAMLASSNYGAGAGKVANEYNADTHYYGDKASSTSNKYGVYGLHNGLAPWEYVAGAIKTRCTSIVNNCLAKAANRYVDEYEDNPSYSMQEAASRYIDGDGTYETIGVPQGGGNFVSSKGPVFGRGGFGVLNSYRGRWLRAQFHRVSLGSLGRGGLLI